MSPPSRETPSAVAAAVIAVPGVSRMSSGPSDQFRSYLPGGETVAGVRFEGDTLFLNIVAAWGVALDELADRVRAAVSAWSGTRVVVVAIDDLDVPDPDASGEGEPVPADGGDP